jgi:hypothetical protein
MGSRTSVVAGLARLGVGLGLSLGIGFLAGCPTVDLGDTPTEIGLCNPSGGEQYFQDQIWPKYVIRNNAPTSCDLGTCHMAGGTGGTGLNFPDPVDYPTAYKRVQVYLNCGTPSASPFLTKPLAGTDAHGGGDIFASLSDPAVQVFLNWFQ